jgi:hypothetical protein
MVFNQLAGNKYSAKVVEMIAQKRMKNRFKTLAIKFK